MLTTTVTSKGQIVIPSKIRKKCDIKKGTKYYIEENGKNIILKPITKEFFIDMAGKIAPKGKLLKTLMLEKKKEKLL